MGETPDDNLSKLKGSHCVAGKGVRISAGKSECWSGYDCGIKGQGRINLIEHAYFQTLPFDPLMLETLSCHPGMQGQEAR